jgi:hypothetical protein
VTGEPGGERQRFTSLFASAEYGTPLAAELPGRPLAEVKRAARQVEPYIAADGSPRWSVRLVGVELATGRRRQRAPEPLTGRPGGPGKVGL